MSARDAVVEMVSAMQAIEIPLFFLLELIRTANKSLLRFHLGNKPLEALAFRDLE